MKNKLQILISTLICLFLLYALLLDKIIPTQKYIDELCEVQLKNSSIIYTESKTGIGYRLHYSVIYSPNESKYYAILYFPQNRFDGFYPKINDGENITVLLNKIDLGSSKFGSKERPIPIINYKITDEFVFDKKQWKFNIKKYQAYCRWPWMKW